MVQSEIDQVGSSVSVDIRLSSCINNSIQACGLHDDSNYTDHFNLKDDQQN